MRSPVVIAVGGNSLIRAGEDQSYERQLENVRSTVECIADLAERGHRIVITHGNGPHVGARLLRAEAGIDQAYAVPLDVCVAMTQGEIGYVIQRALHAELRRRDVRMPVVTIVTQVVVRRDDPAFSHPTKPIGPFYDDHTAAQRKAGRGWVMTEDASRGYRRVVPCPVPMGIVELEPIRECLHRGAIVIAAGGGGIPVIEENGTLTGIEAVIDKDHTSALLASGIGAKTLLISTDVPEVYLNYMQPAEKALSWIDAATARKHLAGGHFHEGSMKPKIDAALEFLASGGEEVIITNPDHLINAVDGYGGTHITKSRTAEFALHEKGLFGWTEFRENH